MNIRDYNKVKYKTYKKLYKELKGGGEQEDAKKYLTEEDYLTYMQNGYKSIDEEQKINEIINQFEELRKLPSDNDKDEQYQFDMLVKYSTEVGMRSRTAENIKNTAKNEKNRLIELVEDTKKQVIKLEEEVRVTNDYLSEEELTLYQANGYKMNIEKEIEDILHHKGRGGIAFEESGQKEREMIPWAQRMNDIAMKEKKNLIRLAKGREEKQEKVDRMNQVIKIIIEAEESKTDIKTPPNWKGTKEQEHKWTNRKYIYLGYQETEADLQQVRDESFKSLVPKAKVQIQKEIEEKIERDKRDIEEKIEQDKREKRKIKYEEERQKYKTKVAADRNLLPDLRTLCGRFQCCRR